MAEEGTLGLARDSRDDRGGEPSKEELQRRMEEARESITQTVTEIKETVTNQYYSMKETVSDALDWRHHFRRNPVAFSVGALTAGFLTGYCLAAALKGDSGRRDDYPSAEESDVYARTGATPTRYDDEELQRRTAFHGHSYAAQAITDSPRGGAEESYERVTDESDAEGAGDYVAERGGAYAYSPPREEAQAEEQPQKPGLLERFKETSAYDRLQTEVASLGDRFIEELSSTAQTVVLPALFNKIKELFGVDLSKKQGQGGGGQQQSRAGGGAASSEQSGAEGGTGMGNPGREARAASAAASSSGAASSLANASRGTSAPSSYATSENRGYGSQSEERGPDNSVLDLDR